MISHKKRAQVQPQQPALRASTGKLPLRPCPPTAHGRRHSKGFRQNLRQTLNLLLQQSEVYQKGIKVFVLTFRICFGYGGTDLLCKGNITFFSIKLCDPHKITKDET